jgi:hypothetical protein
MGYRQEQTASFFLSRRCRLGGGTIDVTAEYRDKPFRIVAVDVTCEPNFW